MWEARERWTAKEQQPHLVARVRAAVESLNSASVCALDQLDVLTVANEGSGSSGPGLEAWTGDSAEQFASGLDQLSSRLRVAIRGENEADAPAVMSGGSRKLLTALDSDQIELALVEVEKIVQFVKVHLPLVNNGPTH